MREERIQKLIAMSSFCSRRKAEDLIRQNKVKFNNQIVKLGDKAKIGDVIFIDNKPIILKDPNKLYIILNKPRGYVTTTKDERGRKTVLSLIESKIKERVYPVGRLDYNSQGLLILTNDGDFANLIMHPKNHIAKKYLVKIKKEIKKEDVEKLQNGVFIDGVKTKKAKVKVISATQKLSEFLITIYEGRNKEIRKMVQIVLNCEVYRLKRVAIGGLVLSNLPSGQFKKLTLKEVLKLKNMQKIKNEKIYKK